MFMEHELFLVAELCRLPDTLFFADHKPELLQYLSKYGDLASDEHKLFDLRPVLCHGDYWHSNIFFKRINATTDGSTEAVDAIIDFQCTKAGTGVGDLLRLIFVGVEPELRHRRFGEWLRLYFACFRNAVIENRTDGDDVNDGAHEIQQMDELIRAVRHHRKHETCFAIFLFKNIICGLSEPDPRRKTLIRRVVALIEDALYWENTGKDDGLEMNSS